jgi:hypothetical protein
MNEVLKQRDGSCQLLNKHPTLELCDSPNNKHSCANPYSPLPQNRLNRKLSIVSLRPLILGAARHCRICSVIAEGRPLGCLSESCRCKDAIPRAAKSPGRTTTLQISPAIRKLASHCFRHVREAKLRKYGNLTIPIDNSAQRTRLRNNVDPIYAALMRLLGAKNSQDAWT